MNNALLLYAALSAQNSENPSKRCLMDCTIEGERMDMIMLLLMFAFTLVGILIIFIYAFGKKKV